MKTAPFRYARPESLDEALALLAEHGDDAKILAGGQSLLPVMALRLGRPEVVVDIGRIPGLATLESGPDGTRIGALVKHRDVEFSDDIARWAPMVAQAMPLIGHRAIRNRGTVVGSIAHADALGELLAVVLATGATMVATSQGGEREIAADDFLHGYFTTALEPTEILTEVRFPAWRPNEGSSVKEFARRHNDYAVMGAAARVVVDGGAITEARLAYIGGASSAVRVEAAEAVLVGATPGADAFAEAATIVEAELDPEGDVHGTATYRRHLAGVLTKDCLAEACAAAEGSDS